MQDNKKCVFCNLTIALAEPFKVVNMRGAQAHVHYRYKGDCYFKFIRDRILAHPLLQKVGGDIQCT